MRSHGAASFGILCAVLMLNLKKLEKSQESTTKMLKGLEHLMRKGCHIWDFLPEKTTKGGDMMLLLFS